MNPMRLLLLAVLAATGCTSTRTLAPDPEGLARVNRTYETRPARLMLASGQYVHARALRLDADSTTWIDPATGILQRAATADIVYVERVRRGRGAWQGAALTGVATAVVMSAVVAADLQDSDWGACDESSFGVGNCHKLPFALRMGTLFGASATLPGALGGAVVGSRERTAFVTSHGMPPEPGTAGEVRPF